MRGLAFSGGKDSWACLWLNKFDLDNIAVIWIDTGKNFPEILESVKKAEKICPNFVRVHVDKKGQNDFHGMPSDIVPINWTLTAQITLEEKPIKIQSYLNCCYENISLSMTKFCHMHGITELINGQRNSDKQKSSSRNGNIVDGIKRIQPLDDWTESEVFDFLAQNMEIPEHFKFKHTSMDCYDCTAYRRDTKDIKIYMKKNYPVLFAEYAEKKLLVDAAILEAMSDE